MQTNRDDKITFVMGSVYGKGEDVLFENPLLTPIRDIGTEIEAFVRGLHYESRGDVRQYGQIVITVERQLSPSEYHYEEESVPHYIKEFLEKKAADNA